MCDSGACAAVCSDECPSDGARRCAVGAADQYQICADHDGDGCLEWGSAASCPSGQVCSSGNCADNCTDECTSAGEKTCQNGRAYTCGQYDADNCLEWGDELQCAAYEACSAGSCAQTNPPAQVVISEVLYDAVGADDDVFIELHGPAGTDLAGFTLVGVNGYNGADYNAISLAGTIGADGLFVVASPNSAYAAQADQTDANVNFQNGPDNIQLRWGTQVVDAVGYGTFGASETFAGEGSPAVDVTAGHSLSRDDNYTDTDDNAADFYDTASPTPGAANPAPAVCGNGTVDPGEVCDGNCPASCDDGDACTADASTGSAATCDLVCTNDPITQCTGGDGCCPSGCTSSTDSDCISPTGDLVWAKQFGASGSPMPSSFADAVTVDAGGNILLAGHYDISIDLGGKTLSHSGLSDNTYVAKFDAAGNRIWSKDVGSAYDDTPEGIAVDSAGDVAITGTDDGNIYVTNFDAAGNQLWRHRLTASSTQSGKGVAFDASGNVYVVGDTSSSVDFGGGVKTAAGNYDVFVAKYDAAGNYVWAKVFGDADAQHAEGIAVDSGGDVVITGSFQGSVDFGGGALQSAGQQDIFVAKLDASGNHVWSKRFGDSDSQEGRSIAVDASGNVLVAGKFQGSVDFGGGAKQSAGRTDAYVVKLDASGHHVWSKRFGDGSFQSALGVAADADGNIILSGNFMGSIDFGGGAFTNNDTFDHLFVAKLDSSGAHLWSKAYAASNTQVFGSVTAGPTRHIYLAGAFYGDIDFGGGTLSAAGSPDAFLVKLAP